MQQQRPRGPGEESAMGRGPYARVCVTLLTQPQPQTNKQTNKQSRRDHAGSMRVVMEPGDGSGIGAWVERKGKEKKVK
jgi:hypothetical protein